MKENNGLLGTLLVASLALVVAVVLLLNMGNFRVPAGYAGYIYSKPIFGKSEFQEVLFGPSSTGWRWRLAGTLLSITPYTYPEEYAGKTSVLALDKLPLESKAHIVWKIKNDSTQIRNFLEKFGGWDTTSDPDKIALEAYNQFIKEPFRTETRVQIAKYNGLDVNAELINISNAVKNAVTERLKDTPFEVLDIVMGNANPPEVVIQAISSKVASEQMLQQRSIQLEIEKKNVEVETQQGKAAGAKAAAQAEEEAKAISAIKAVLSPQYISYLGVQNIKGAQRVFVPTTASILVGADQK